jgi:Xaa-Pro dipeptidase
VREQTIAAEINLPQPPAGAVSPTELARRLETLRTRMENDKLDTIVLSDKKNVEYFTDLHSFSWAYKARPVFVVVTAGDIILVGSLTERRNIETTPRIFTAHYYDGYLAEAVEAVSCAVRDATEPGAPAIALDYGQDMFGRGSLELVEALREISRNQQLASAAETIWSVRLIKSALEIERKQTAFAIVNEAFDHSISRAHIGISEYELCSMVQQRIYRNGAESADPIAMLFSKGDFIYCRPPGPRLLEHGHYIWTDFRATYGGYPADRNRTARAGDPESWETELYDLTRDLTIELASSIRPGMACCDVYSEFHRLWKGAGLDSHYGAISRIGHGGGLDVTEPPSISAFDRTEIRPGMILHLEPKLERDGAVFQFEEVIAVTPEGAEFISELSPERIPIVR